MPLYGQTAVLWLLSFIVQVCNPLLSYDVFLQCNCKFTPNQPISQTFPFIFYTSLWTYPGAWARLCGSHDPCKTMGDVAHMFKVYPQSVEEFFSLHIARHCNSWGF
eukprot:1351133-Amorphochlora_amoeboformis.AAC.3